MLKHTSSDSSPCNTTAGTHTLTHSAHHLIPSNTSSTINYFLGLIIIRLLLLFGFVRCVCVCVCVYDYFHSLLIVYYIVMYVLHVYLNWCFYPVHSFSPPFSTLSSPFVSTIISSAVLLLLLLKRDSFVYFILTNEFDGCYLATVSERLYNIHFVSTNLCCIIIIVYRLVCKWVERIYIYSL